MEENKQVVAEWKALNQPRLQEIKKANPDLYSAVNLALQYLNTKLGGEELPAEVEQEIEIQTSTMPTKQWTLYDFENKKIIVDTPEKSRKFQEFIFSLGGFWNQDVVKNQKSINLTDKPFLGFRGVSLAFYRNESDFKEDNAIEIFYDDIFPPQTATNEWTLDDFRDIKIFVNTPEKSKKFQELFLSLGGKWSNVDVKDDNKRHQVNFTDKKYLTTTPGGKMVFYDAPKSFYSSVQNKIYYDDIFPEEVSQTATTSSEGEYTWPIETYPSILPLPLPNFANNKGDRKSPSQSAGELKSYVSTRSGKEIIDYSNMFATTKFKGNDGNWYAINVGKSGTWTWKQTTPPLTQSTLSAQPVATQTVNYKPEDLIGREIYYKGDYKVLGILKVNPKTVLYKIANNLKDIELGIPKTAIGDLLEGKVVGKAFLRDWKPSESNTTEVKNDLLKMTDAELLKLYSEIEEAKNELDPSDPEYTELRLQQIEVSNELDKRN